MKNKGYRIGDDGTVDFHPDKQEEKLHCVECGGLVDHWTGIIKGYFCTDPACPNYALSQVPIELMPTEVEKV